MYLRKSKKKNGRVYLTIVEAYRDERGKNMSRTVESLGYVDDLERSGIADPIGHFTEECARRNEARRAGTEPVIVKIGPLQRIDKRDGEARVELGAAVVDAYLNRDLGLWSFFERRRTARRVSFDPYRVLELLVWDRIAHPSSKKGAWERRAAFPRKCPFSLGDVYRALTYLDERRGELVAHANASLEAARGPRDTRVLYYDVTNFFFEVEGEDGFRMRGVSKEHRPSPIVQMGLFLDADGIPLDYALFPGNAPDVATLVPAMEGAGVRFGPDSPERVVVVADKGLNASANIARCILGGSGYVFSQSVRRADAGLRSWVLADEGYASNEEGTYKVKSRIGEKAVYVTGEDGRRKRVMVPVKQVAFWSRRYAATRRAPTRGRARATRGRCPWTPRPARSAPPSGSSTRPGSPRTPAATGTAASSPPSRTWPTGRSSTATGACGGSRSRSAWSRGRWTRGRSTCRPRRTSAPTSSCASWRCSSCA